MKKILLLTTVLGLLLTNGCATVTVPENFVPKASSDFNIDIKLYNRSYYHPGECGFDRLKAQGWLPAGAPGSYEKTYKPIEGVLVLANSKILFIVAGREKYEEILEIKYDEIVDVLVPALGRARRLVIKRKDNCHTFSIVSGKFIDREKTYEFFRFIADKAHIPIPEKFRENAK